MKFSLFPARSFEKGTEVYKRLCRNMGQKVETNLWEVIPFLPYYQIGIGLYFDVINI